jgi:hypothetical protein
MRFLPLLSSSSRQIPQQVVAWLSRCDLLSWTSFGDGFLSVFDCHNCLFLVEKKRCCFSEFLFGGIFLFLISVPACNCKVVCIALIATIADVKCFDDVLKASVF